MHIYHLKILQISMIISLTFRITSTEANVMNAFAYFFLYIFVARRRLFFLAMLLLLLSVPSFRYSHRRLLCNSFGCT